MLILKLRVATAPAVRVATAPLEYAIRCCVATLLPSLPLAGHDVIDVHYVVIDCCRAITTRLLAELKCRPITRRWHAFPCLMKVSKLTSSSTPYTPTPHLPTVIIVDAVLVARCYLFSYRPQARNQSCARLQYLHGESTGLRRATLRLVLLVRLRVARVVVFPNGTQGTHKLLKSQ